jgi:hypothetical protein
LALKKPFWRCTFVTAVAIAAVAAAVAAGIPAPSTMPAPPTVSASAAARALRSGGYMRVLRIIVAVPSSPGPSKAPVSFCIPCATKMPPITTLNSSLPIPMGQRHHVERFFSRGLRRMYW